MASASLSDGTLTLTLRTWDKILSVHGSLHIPLEHVTAAKSGPAPEVPYFTKVIGANLPGVGAAGTFFDSEGLLFYDFGAGHECLLLDLDHERFHRVAIEIDPPQAAATVAENINAVIASRPPAAG